MGKIEKDYSVSFVRFIATLFIVLCHVMQYCNFVLAWWFNVGVQIFLFLSGYLYGKKQHVDTVGFYIKNFMKLLIDFYLYAAAIVVVILFLEKRPLGKVDIVNFLLLKHQIPGLRHFWFIPCILVCYGLTPVLLPIVNRIDAGSMRRFVLLSVLCLAAVDVVFNTILSGVNSVWISCYILGMLFVRIEKRGVKSVAFVGLLILTVLMNGVQVYIDYFLDLKFSGLIETIYIQWCSYAHVYLGFTLVVVLRWLYNKFLHGMRWLTKILDWSDRYSYDVYITHHYFIFGQYSLLALPVSFIITVPLVFVSTVVSAILLRTVSVYLSSKLCKRHFS